MVRNNQRRKTRRRMKRSGGMNVMENRRQRITNKAAQDSLDDFIAARPPEKTPLPVSKQRHSTRSYINWGDADGSELGIQQVINAEQGRKRRREESISNLPGNDGSPYSPSSRSTGTTVSANSSESSLSQDGGKRRRTRKRTRKGKKSRRKGKKSKRKGKRRRRRTKKH